MSVPQCTNLLYQVSSDWVLYLLRNMMTRHWIQFTTLFTKSVHYSHVAHSMFHWAHMYGGGQGSHGAQVSCGHQPDHPPAATLVPIDTYSSHRLLHKLLLTLREVSQPGLGRVPIRGEVVPRALVLFSHVP